MSVFFSPYILVAVPQSLFVYSYTVHHDPGSIKSAYIQHFLYNTFFLFIAKHIKIKKRKNKRKK